MYRRLFYLIDNEFDVVEIVSHLINSGKNKILILTHSIRCCNSVLKKINKKCGGKFDLNKFGLISESTICLCNTVYDNKETAPITVLLNKSGVLDDIKIKNIL